MYINKEALAHYRTIFSDNSNLKSEAELFLKILNKVIEHIKSENALKKFAEELYTGYCGEHAGGIFNVATTRGAMTLFVESWFEDIKIIENLFIELQKEIKAFGKDSKNPKEIVLLIEKITKESSGLAYRINTFFKEEHYIHRFLEGKTKNEFEENIVSWIK